MLSTQWLSIETIPVDTLTFGPPVQPETSILALALAAHAGLKSVLRREPGPGGVFGDVQRNTLWMGEVEGMGKEEKGDGERCEGCGTEWISEDLHNGS